MVEELFWIGPLLHGTRGQPNENHDTHKRLRLGDCFLAYTIIKQCWGGEEETVGRSVRARG